MAVYRGTDFLPKRIIPHFGATALGFAADAGTAAMQEAVNQARAKGPVAAPYLETPANPTNSMMDIRHARQLTESLRDADGRRPLVIVDNTVLGPLYQSPLTHGADLIAGGCSGSRAVLEPIRGMRPAMIRDSRRDSAYLFGAICPARTVGAAMIMPSTNTEAMNEHLKEISSQVSTNMHAVLLHRRLAAR
jgi:methionine-gamma-lyase